MSTDPRKSTRKIADEKFRLFFQDNPQPMWLLDRDSGRLLEVNDAASRLSGYTRDEMLAMRVTDLLPAEDAAAGRESLHKLDSMVQPIEWRQRLKDGKLIDVEVMAQEIRYARKRAVLAVLIDVTRRKQLEAQLLQAQKMEAVGMLAGGIAHDFNNLLTIITGYSQLLLASLSQGDRNRTSVEQIMKAGDRAAALTRQLLSFSRRQTMQPKVLDLNSLVGSLAVMLRRLIGEDIDLQLDLAKDAGQVNADAGKIEQVIMNLAVNSRDAMPNGGTLTIQTKNVDLDEHYTRTQTRVKPGPYVMLAVNDNGTGMDAETREHLFEPFFTTKGQGRGTGLGLSIVFGIVRQTGGNLEVATEPGAGTSVKIYLPRVEEVAVPEPESAVTATERGGSETILVVEDDDMVRKLVRETLEHEGYKILEAATPEQAAAISRTYENPIHLMITDVVMPQESGRSLASRLVRQRPDMKVIFMSGYTDTNVIGEGDWTKAEFLQKPFTPAVLARKVHTVLKPANGDKYRRAGGL